MTTFDYHTAFSRNIGWVTPAEQERLRRSRIAIAGMGGVGGSHLLTLTRLGVGRFHLADFDSFAVENFNRQAGANLQTVGRPKLDALCEMALAINPELQIGRFPEGVRPEAAEEFRTVVRLNPELIEGRLNLGIALTRLGSNQEAQLQMQAQNLFDNVFQFGHFAQALKCHLSFGA